MKSLKQFLSCLNGSSSVEDVQSAFAEIAEILLYKSQIKTCLGNYRIIEIEFYFNSQKHKDTKTILRNEEPGMWWLHEWGVDISFNSNNDFYGGIIIRSIIDEDEDRYICGPQKCCQELFYSSAVDECISPQIVGGMEYQGIPKHTGRQVKGTDKWEKDGYRYFVSEIKMDKVKNYKDSPWKKLYDQ